MGLETRMNAVLFAFFPHCGGFGVKKLVLPPVRAGKESAVSTPSVHGNQLLQLDPEQKPSPLGGKVARSAG